MKSLCYTTFILLVIITTVLLYMMFTENARLKKKEKFTPLSMYKNQLKKEVLPRIHCVPKDKGVEVSWTATIFNVKQYIIKVEEINNPSMGIQLTVVPDPDCKQCKRTIPNLRNGEPHLVSLIIYTNDGKLKKPTPVSVIPNGPIDTSSISDILLKSEDEISKSIDTIDIPCEFYRDTQKQFHELDKNYKPLINYVSSLK